MSTASINGVTVSRGSLTLPRRGIWLAMTHLSDVLAITDGAAVTLTFADLTLSGHVVPGHGGTFAGASDYWIAGGTGGWTMSLKAKQYRNDAGVRLTKVISDLATETGETVVSDFTDRILGTGFERIYQEATATLRAVCPDGWYVAEDGRTHIGRRRASTPTIDPTAVLKMAPERAMAFLASDKIAGIVPEATIAGLHVTHVTHTLQGPMLRSRVWGSP